MIELPGSFNRHLKELGFGLLIFLSMLSSLHPYVRQWLRNQILSEPRAILSTTMAQVMGNDRLQKIIKIKSKDGIGLEIYDPTDDGRPNLVQKISLPDHIDGFVYINRAATNLAVFDVNHDRIPEIVAPSFDHNLGAHLNVFKYDHESRRFIPLTTEL